MPTSLLDHETSDHLLSRCCAKAPVSGLGPPPRVALQP